MNLMDQAFEDKGDSTRDAGFIPPFKKFTIDEDLEVKKINYSNITVAGQQSQFSQKQRYQNSKNTSSDGRQRERLYHQPAVAKGKLQDSIFQANFAPTFVSNTVFDFF